MAALSEALPEIQDPTAVDCEEAKALSRALFDRLRLLEEGSADYSYVRGTLIELNLSLVKFAARRFGHSHESMEDIVQVGTIGLIKAIDRFDPDRGLEFTTFALPTICGEIKRFFRDTTWAVHVPRRLQELHLALAKAGDELEQELEHTPSVAELAEHLQLSEQEVAEGMVASNGRTVGSLDLQLELDSREGSLGERLGADDPGIERAEYLQDLKPLIAALPERDRTILSLRFSDDLTQSQIAERLGISQMHVSRLLSRALATLRSGLE